MGTPVRMFALPGAHFRAELDAHDVRAAHERAHVHIDAEPEAVENGQNVIKSAVISDGFAQKFFRLRAEAVEHGIVVRDDLGFARRAAAGEIDGGFAVFPLCRGEARVAALFKERLERLAERRAFVGHLIIDARDEPHVRGAVAHKRGDAEIRLPAFVQVVYEDELAARLPRALFQLFGREKGMHEIDARAQLVRRIKAIQRGGRVGHAQRDGISLADAVLRGEVVRKGVYGGEHVVEGIFFSVEGDRGADGAARNVQQQRIVHRGVCGDRFHTDVCFLFGFLCEEH